MFRVKGLGRRGLEASIHLSITHIWRFWSLVTHAMSP